MSNHGNVANLRSSSKSRQDSARIRSGARLPSSAAFIYPLLIAQPANDHYLGRSTKISTSSFL